jgi:murein DD-endopeptidase MepM/ murein hydrolase activator NlpD
MKGFLLFLLGALVGAACLWFVVFGRSPTPPPATQAVEPPPPAEQAVVTTPTAPAASTIIATPATLQTPAAAVSIADIALPSIDRTPPAITSSLTAPTTPLLPPAAQLLIPVAGIKAQALTDTFTDARGEGRVHDAIDIMATRGTPVLATDDGKVEKLFNSKQGGLTLYQFDPTGGYAYYYAHLDSYAPGIAEGKPLHRGDVIGYVGSTGNASPDAPHLHFAIFVLGPEKRWWQGTAINPYPLLSGRH